MVQFLLDNNASVTWRELEGAGSAIDCAAKAGLVSIIEMLLKNGAVGHNSPTLAGVTSISLHGADTQP